MVDHISSLLLWLTTLALFSIGLLLLIFGSFFLYRTRRKLRQWYRTLGVVIGEEKRDVTEVNPGISPIVRFTAHDNRQIEFIEQNYYYPPRYQIGEQVEVIYDPQNLQKARILTKSSEMTYFARSTLITGLVFILVSIFIAATTIVTSQK